MAKRGLREKPDRRHHGSPTFPITVTKVDMSYIFLENCWTKTALTKRLCNARKSNTNVTPELLLIIGHVHHLSSLLSIFLADINLGFWRGYSCGFMFSIIQKNVKESSCENFVWCLLLRVRAYSIHIHGTETD